MENKSMTLFGFRAEGSGGGTRAMYTGGSGGGMRAMYTGGLEVETWLDQQDVSALQLC